MARIKRLDVGGQIFHVLNRSNIGIIIFESDYDYKTFEKLLEKYVIETGIKLYAYCLMPNHWHLVLKPVCDGGMSEFVFLLSNTHTKQWHAEKDLVGKGHLYQDRYKSFICKDDNYFLTLMKYVERNPLKAGLVSKAEDWRWSSLWRRLNGTEKQKSILSDWPVAIPENYLDWINTVQEKEKIEIIEKSIEKGYPLGDFEWVEKIIEKYDLEQLKEKKRGRKPL